MRITIKLLSIISLLLLLSACDNPLPSSKLSYEGVWKSENMILVITREGQVSYERKEGTMTTSINGPIKEFTKNGFSVGFAFLTSEFIVNQKPKEVDGQWIMIVDGVILTKIKHHAGVQEDDTI